MQRLNPIWKSSLSTQCRLRLFKILVLSIVSYGCSAWNASQLELHDLDIEISKMRRIVCGVKNSWDGTKRMRLESLYCGDKKLSTIARCQRAKLMEHLIRHSSIFCQAMGWREEVNTKSKSILEACARDIGMNAAELLYFSISRASLNSKIQQLEDRLEPRPKYVKWKTGPWAGKHQRVTSSKEAQFVEEGDVPFKIRANEMHLYTDGALSTKKNQIATGCAYVSLRVGNQKLMVGMRPPEDVPFTIMAVEAYGAFAALL